MKVCSTGVMTRSSEQSSPSDRKDDNWNISNRRIPRIVNILLKFSVSYNANVWNQRFSAIKANFELTTHRCLRSNIYAFLSFHSFSNGKPLSQMRIHTCFTFQTLVLDV